MQKGRFLEEVCRIYSSGRVGDITSNLISPRSPERLLLMWLKQFAVFIGFMSLLWVVMQIVYGLLTR